jgi:limonene-1,2-epoxide hydrolase
MKKIMLVLLAGTCCAACNNPASTTGAPSAMPIMGGSVNYAYPKMGNTPVTWEKGDPNNTAIVLSSLKAFENMDGDKAMAAFADSVHWAADGIDQVYRKDTLAAMLKRSFENTKSVKIEMHDYESVVSKDSSQAYVTRWYKQIITDKSGKIDSMSVVEDAKILNGKIVEMDEKSRKYPVKK